MKNPNDLPVQKRVIASVVIVSADGKVLLGKKDRHKGGVYADVWHLPGGGADADETLEQAAVREVREEVGISIDEKKLQKIDDVGSGETEKMLRDGISSV